MPKYLLHAIHTACGIETPTNCAWEVNRTQLHAIHTACGIETLHIATIDISIINCMQSIPLAVLKLTDGLRCATCHDNCMQSIPLAVLKQPTPGPRQPVRLIACNPYRLRYWNIEKRKVYARVTIACNPYRLRYWNGSSAKRWCNFRRIACNPYRLRYWNVQTLILHPHICYCMQSIPLAVFFLFLARFFQTCAFFMA